MTLTAHVRRTSLAGAALAAAAVLTAGCSSSSSSSSAPSGAAPASPNPAIEASNAVPSAIAASAGAACATTDLNATVGGSQGSAGSIYTVINFTNIGGRPCTLYGYPGVSLTDSASGQIGAAATRSQAHPAQLVSLAPGAKGNVVLQLTDAMNYPYATCSPTTTAYLRIYPPNQTQALEVPFKATGCSKDGVKLLTISVVTPGTGSAG
jgi:hypothetical protein